MGRLAGGLLGVAAALTVCMAWPVLRQPSNRLFGSEIVGRHEAPFIVISKFENPRGPGLYTQPATDYIGAALAAVTGDGVVALNLLVLSSFPLAALFAGLLTLCLTRSVPAAWFAGLAYAFAPFHLAQSAYHPHGSQIQWLPLYLLALWLCLETISVGRSLLLAAATALVVLSNFYYGLIAAAITPVVLVGFWLVSRADHRPHARRSLYLTALALGLIAAVGVGWVVLFAPQVITSPETLAFPRADLLDYSARWWSYLLPPVGHPLAGGWVDSIWSRVGRAGMLEQQLTVGAGLLLLAAIAAIAVIAGIGYRRGNRVERVGLGAGGLGAVAITAAAAFLLSLRPGSGLASLMPSGFLHELLPMFRAYARFGLVVYLMISILAAAGFVYLLGRRSRGTSLLAFALLALSVVELAPFPPWRWRDVLPTAAHRWLAGQPEGIRVLDCVPARDFAQRTAARFLGHPMGWLRGLEDCGDSGLAGWLAGGGTSHVVARRSSPFGRHLSEWPPPQGLELVREFDDSLLLSVRAAPTEVHVSPAAGFSWREYRGSESYRWMGGVGSLSMVNAAQSSQTGTLEIVLHAFPGLRTLHVRLDGSTVAELEISTDPRSYEIGPLELARGSHTLELETDTPAVVADEVLHNGDDRPLAVAVWDWRWRIQ